MKNNHNEKHDSSRPLENNSRSDQHGDNSMPIYSTNDSTLQTPAEHKHDKSVDPRKSSKMDISNDDLRETNADKMAGSDRAGTAERKDNSL